MTFKFIATIVASTALYLLPVSAQGETQLLTGAYSDGALKGMKLLRFDAARDEFTIVKSFEAIENASFALYDSDNGRVYVTGEADTGQVGAFRLSEDHLTLTPLGYVSSLAGSPCYLALSPDKSRLAVANYHGDIVAVFKIDAASGALQSNPDILKGTDTTKTGHAHWVQWSPEGDKIYMVDLGHDEVRAYPYDAKTGAIGAATSAFKTPVGSGPRHMAFSPDGRFAYVVTEYANTVIALKREAGGSLSELQTISTLPADYKDKSFAAHIQINKAGDTLYMTNRGHNSLGVFRIQADGQLKPLQTISTGGDWPRFFLLLEDEKRLLVAHQRSNDIRTFHINNDGSLAETPVKFALPKPVMILPLK
ncbi:lactonase family protein [Asticcacaulis machinosus]|uniref:Lactonase family protein n=1 Tax=Asticcacaulis machinosus TaxID=2984211 RepID=A0ABT5HL53_9CAUL|nr:lactonase family protein [Asticcacaulis machinosus]MDC7676718.1 lactonase family protein [Asticcacaulis machinosus]